MSGHFWLPFEEAKKKVHALGLESWNEWQDWSKSGRRPTNIPANPLVMYRDAGWISMPDWLG